jgi:hypothetical protein
MAVVVLQPVIDCFAKLLHLPLLFLLLLSLEYRPIVDVVEGTFVITGTNTGGSYHICISLTLRRLDL